MDRRLAVHRTIVIVDVEGFGDQRRTNRQQVEVRDVLYQAMREAFGDAGIPWDGCDHEDRGDGIFILVPAEVPKSLLVESLPPPLISALHRHNGERSGQQSIRLRLALHAVPPAPLARRPSGPQENDGQHGHPQQIPANTYPLIHPIQRRRQVCCHVLHLREGQ